MHSKNYYKKIVLVALWVSFLLGWAGNGIAKTARIVIFPLEIHADRDLEYLQVGIFEMLTNRLASSDKMISVIPRPEITARLATMPSGSLEDKSSLTRSLQADYFISGSLTILGQQISTDVQFFRLEQPSPLVRLSRTGTQHGEVIGHIDEFAALVNQEVFERATRHESPTEESGTIPLLDETGDTVPDGLSLVAEDTAKKGRWQSKIFNSNFKGLSVGDIDNDGANEIVLIDRHTIYIFRYENDHLVKLTQVEKSRHALFLSVDVADINGNGMAEIFITNYATISEQPNAFIIEYDGDKFRLLAENIKRYYRVMSQSANDHTLLAQKYVGTTLFARNIQVMAYEKGRYVNVDKFAPPNNLNIYEMAIVPRLKGHNRVFIAYVHNHEIAALSPGGERIWNTNQEFDGSLNYFEYTAPNDVKERARYYIPQRILFKDTDDNAKFEIVAAHNIDSTLGVFPALKRYKKGYISCIELGDNDELELKWKTVEEDGYISDLAVVDITNDGKPDLIFTVVKQTGSGLKKSWNSYVVIQQLP